MHLIHFDVTKEGERNEKDLLHISFCYKRYFLLAKFYPKKFAVPKYKLERYEKRLLKNQLNNIIIRASICY